MDRDRAADDAVLVEAIDDPTIIRALIELSKNNELAMNAVRLGLAFHVLRWHRIMHGGEAVPEEVPEDLLAVLKEALAAVDRR